VRLPASALHGRDRVFTVVDGRLRERRVELVARVGNDVLVRGALKADERVLTTRFAEIGAGVRVEVR
jgi:pentose-5-phosphate-3-epimerase